MEIIFVLLFLYAGKHAWDQAWDAWRKSRSAYMDHASAKYPGMSGRRQAGHAMRHDLGYGLSQVAHGFPQARHGFAAGWHQGRQAHAQVRAERERAKAEHLETRARLIQDLREYRRRQRAALEQIRRGEPWATEDGSDDNPEPSERVCSGCGWAIPGTGPCPTCGTRETETEGQQGAGHGYCAYCGTRDDRQCPPECATWTLRGTPYPGREDDPTYSWGPAGSQMGWPSATLEHAHSQARHMSTDGNPKVVTEYPPGGGPGATVTTYVNGHAVADCDLCGKPLPPGYADIAHPGCIDAREAGGSEEGSSPSTEGNAMPDTSGDTTYTQQLGELAAIRADAEEEVNSVRRKRMASRLDILTGLGLDSASLSEAAAIDDALQAQEKAAQQTLDAADAAIHGLKQRHGGIQEAVSSSPVDKPAQPEFYQD